jgi:hypothetical protein
MTRLLPRLITAALAVFTLSVQAQCPLTIDSIIPTSTLCVGSCDGAATVSVSGPGNLTYQWYDVALNPIIGATGSTLSGVCTGDYTVDITTNEGGGGTVVLFEETFDLNPNWTLTNPTGNNGADANYWVISDSEGGVTPPGCGIANNGNATMHITAAILPGLGALYNTGGPGSCPDISCPEANIRADSPMINTVGNSNLTLEFDFISVGDLMNDNASVWYNDGSGWSQLTATIKSLVCPGTGQGEWTTYSEPLPASCENITNLQIGINWTNNEDSIGSDPSVAINDLMVSAIGATEPCTISSQTITIGQPNPLFMLTQQATPTSCASVSNGIIEITGGGGHSPYSFSIDGGATFTNTTGVFSGLSVGTYALGLQDANGCIYVGDSLNLGVAALVTPSITGDFEMCEGDSVTLIASGGFASYIWIPSGSIGQAYVASVGGSTIVVAADTAGCESESNPVTVIEHPTPMPVIIGDTIICESEESMLNAGSGFVSYEWSPNGETTQVVDVEAGSYSVAVVDFFGCSGVSDFIAVNELQFTEVDIQAIGDSIFVDPTAGTGFQWHLDGYPIPGGTNSHFIAEMSGVYTLYYIDAFGCSHFSIEIDHVYISVDEVNNEFKLYPNPAVDFLRIEMNSNGNVNKNNIKIVDGTGRNIEVDVSNSHNGFSVDLSSLSNGVYLLSVSLESGIQSRLFMVNRN